MDKYGEFHRAMIHPTMPCMICSKGVDTETENYIWLYVLQEDVLFHLSCLPKYMQKHFYEYFDRVDEQFQARIRDRTEPLKLKHVSMPKALYSLVRNNEVERHAKMV